MLGTCPNTTFVGVMDSNEEGLKQTNEPACKITYLYAEVGRLDLISNGLAIDCNFYGHMVMSILIVFQLTHNMS